MVYHKGKNVWLLKERRASFLELVSPRLSEEVGRCIRMSDVRGTRHVSTMVWNKEANETVGCMGLFNYFKRYS